MTALMSYRLGLGLAVATALFLVLGIGALGIIGAGGRPDRVYAVVLVVLVAGSIAARLKASGMAPALAATALTQILVTTYVFATGGHRTEAASVTDILMINAMYAALFLASAWLFQRAAGLRSAVRTSS